MLNPNKILMCKTLPMRLMKNVWRIIVPNVRIGILLIAKMNRIYFLINIMMLLMKNVVNVRLILKPWKKGKLQNLIYPHHVLRVHFKQYHQSMRKEKAKCSQITFYQLKETVQNLEMSMSNKIKLKLQLNCSINVTIK